MAKISKYNLFLNRPDGSKLAYNAVSGALAMMTEENYTVYQNIVKKLAQDPKSELLPEEDELMKQMVYASFAYKENVDEADNLYFLHHQARFDESNLGLTIAPTMACNMACEYCYENNKKGRMEQETQNALLDFIKKRGSKLDELSITWYGGEPLLAKDVIEDLTLAFLDLGQQYNFKYNASIITNGYLLDSATVDLMVKLHIKNVQITIDGPAELHNKKRPLKNGKPSFEKIIENLKYASTKMLITIRVNIDRSFTSEMIYNLLTEFKSAGLQDKIGVYFGMLEPATTTCSNISEICYGNFDFSNIEVEFYNLLLDNEFAVCKLPSPLSIFCTAQSVSGYVIDQDGYLYKCFNYVGNLSKSMGNIRDEINFKHENFMGLFRFDPFLKQSCRECDILPICMGGCPSQRYDQGASDEEVCSSWKHNLPQMLEIIALSRQRQMASANKE